jgi:ABC-type Mn2+/Zn2+ transport system permease subunit
MTSFFVVMGIVLWVILAFWPAIIAKRKGYSFALFLIIALLVSWLLSLVIILVMKDKNQTAESIAADQAAEAALEKEENR